MFTYEEMVAEKFVLVTHVKKAACLISEQCGVFGQGVRDERCLLLAEKHSQAVDFPKVIDYRVFIAIFEPFLWYKS